MAKPAHIVDQLRELKDCLAATEIERWRDILPESRIDEFDIKERVGTELAGWIRTQGWPEDPPVMYEYILSRTRYWVIRSAILGVWSRANDFFKKYYKLLESRLNIDQFTAICLKLLFCLPDKIIGDLMGCGRKRARQYINQAISELTGLEDVDIRQELKRLAGDNQ